MIDGEEIFESAAETGYRLCCSADQTSDDRENDKHSVFSASWDKNNPQRLFVCSMKGKLTVKNTKTNNSSDYDVIFRRSTTYENSILEPEKIVQDHWDRMVTIPDRPNEIIFLLGISRTLYYTALPGVENDEIVTAYPKDTPALIASTTRSDFPGYDYGTPIMEISAHVARITSLAVSPAGHVLASGDELGNVRLLLLQLLDELSIVKKQQQKRRKHIVDRHFNTFLPSYNITNKVHKDSIFSLEWLPAMHIQNDVRYYGLATGSTENGVRIWTVACCTRTGLSMIPCQMLNAMGTSVLSLNSYLLIDKTLEISIAHAIASSREAAEMMNNSTNSHPLNGSYDRSYDEEQEAANDAIELRNAKSVYLTAGTQMGTIYVWKMNYNNLIKILVSAAGESVDAGQARDADDLMYDLHDLKFSTPGVSAAATAESAMKKKRSTDFRHDDGTALHSVVQTSDRPIIHVSITSNGNPNISTTEAVVGGARHLDNTTMNSSDHVLLAASDTNGLVRIHVVDRTAGGGGHQQRVTDFGESVEVNNSYDSDVESIGASISGDRQHQQQNNNGNNISTAEMSTVLRLNRHQEDVLRFHEQTITRVKEGLKHAGARLESLQSRKDSLGGMFTTAGRPGGSSVAVGVNNNKPIIVAGDMLYESPVVACAFQLFTTAADVTSGTRLTSTNGRSVDPLFAPLSPGTSVSGSGINSPMSTQYNLQSIMSSVSISNLLSWTPPALLVTTAAGRIISYSSDNIQTILAPSGGGNNGLSHTESARNVSDLLEFTLPGVNDQDSGSARGSSARTSPADSEKDRVMEKADRVIQQGGRISGSNSSVRSQNTRNTTGSGSAAKKLTFAAPTQTSNKGREADSIYDSGGSPIPRPPLPAPSIMMTTSAAADSGSGTYFADSRQSHSRPAAEAADAPRPRSKSPVPIAASGRNRGAAVATRDNNGSSLPQPPTEIHVGGGITLKSNINRTSATASNGREDDSLMFRNKNAATSAATLRSGALNSRQASSTTNATAATGTSARSGHNRTKDEEGSVAEEARPLHSAPKPYQQATTASVASMSPAAIALKNKRAAASDPNKNNGVTVTRAVYSSEYEDIAPQYRNDYAAPAQHSSKFLAANLRKELDDDISVSTLHTTQSDRLAATRAVTSDLPLDARRYAPLTKLDATDPTAAGGTEGPALRNGTARSKLSKQVDPSYLARKQYGGPSEADNKVLYAPDPLVERSLYFGPAKKFNTECGLYCETDKNTLQTTFRHEVNAGDILGNKNILSEIRRGEEAMEMFHVNYVLDSMISANVPVL